MKRFSLIALITAAVVAAAILSGCGAGADVSTPEVGDILPGGYEVTLVDPAGGYIAEKVDGSTTVARVTGQFTGDVTFSASKVYELDGPVQIGDNTTDAGNTLTIEPGTLIKGLPHEFTSYLLIDKGSMIDAQGTKDDPIVFTSGKAAGIRASGDWGGIVINGYAPVQGGTRTGEGGTGTYGGDDPDDDSGILNYVIVQFAGTLFSEDNQLNGIAFQGVGTGTEVDYIQVHKNGDDGVEFFGGTVRATHVVLTGNDDDALDFDNGWNGSAQFVVIQNYGADGDAIEADGDAPEAGDIPAASAYVANMTIIGSGADDGPRFKNATDPTLYNSIIVNYPTGTKALEETADATVDYFGVAVEAADDPSGDAAGWAADIAANAWNATVESLVVWPDETHIATEDLGELDEDDEDATLADNTWSFNAQPTSITGSAPAAASIPSEDPAGNEMVDTDYLGAVDPDGDDWTAGWLLFPAY